MKIVTGAEMRHIDEQAESVGLTTAVLMETAGLRVAEEVARAFGSLRGRKCLVLVGPGNNGGDGLVAARHLRHWGADVGVYLWNRRLQPDPNLDEVVRRNVGVADAQDDPQYTGLEAMLGEEAIVIDALLGSSKARPIEGTLAALLGTINRLRAPMLLHVVAVDLPTGLDADTGKVDPATVPAELTVTLALPKLGLLTGEGPLYTGHLVIADIGIPEELSTHVARNLTTPGIVGTYLPSRPPAAHKGTFGRVLVIGGCREYIGATTLAAAAAYRAGAGLVTLAVPASIQSAVASRIAEATYLPLAETSPGYMGGPAALEAVLSALPGYEAVLVGPGLGTHPGTREFLLRLMRGIRSLGDDGQPPWGGNLVFDADALNLLATEAGWPQALPPHCVMTPHPGEMARLLGVEVADVQRDRVGVALQAANDWLQVVILKGAHTVVAEPAGNVFVDPGANALLASAGSGDVLGGAVAGLLAQGMNLTWASIAGVNLHSGAGDLLSEDLGEGGMLASDLLPLLPRVAKARREAALAWRRRGRLPLSRAVTWVV